MSGKSPYGSDEPLREPGWTTIAGSSTKPKRATDRQGWMAPTMAALADEACREGWLGNLVMSTLFGRQAESPWASLDRHRRLRQLMQAAP